MLNLLRAATVVLALLEISLCQKSESKSPAFYTIQEHLNNDAVSSAAQRELRVEDFFWSGSGDGPPEFIKKVHSAKPDGNEVIIKTETLIATVYVEGHNDEDILCLDCVTSSNGLPLNYSTDRRYWLMTVVAGFLRSNDYPLLEGNLAKLYRIAFTRQQSYHLGITNHLFDKDNATIRGKRESLAFAVHYKVRVKRRLPLDIEDDDPAKSVELATHKNNEKKDSKAGFYDGRTPDNDVKVLIHNVSLITEEAIQNWDMNYDEMNDQRSSRPMANQTEIIYSVFVNGKPVLATAAAEDMKLVSENEAVTVMKKDIYMKAEPYLKEPQATPLVPASKNGSSVIYNVLTSHPVMIAISSVVIFLLILLLIALLLMTRAKRQRSAEVKRLSSRQGLLSSRSEADDFVTNRTATDGGISRLDLDDGIDNAAFMYDHPRKPKNESRKRDQPCIDFPLPPVSRPDSTSTTSTSDSSVYCPVNRPDIDLQAMLDEKAHNLFDKRKKINDYQENQKPEHTYSSAVKKREKRGKTKSKRKYLAENRVGSIEETVQVHSSQGSYSTDSVSESLRPEFNQLAHSEAFNPNANYHKNKVLRSEMFTDKIYDTVDNARISPTQAINREIIKALEPGEKTSESGSIGSFLSMASVKSFPRQQLPEPLHRVLEPVSVTHYDYFDNVVANRVVKRPRNAKTVTVVDYSKHSHSDTPDPGVVGPIVWEIHKKRLENENEGMESPLRDPASTRNRFEGLLEGAIQMYTDGTIAKISPVKGAMGVSHRWKDSRGKSAIIPSSGRLSRSNSESRPVTAGPTQSHSNHSTRPPTPKNRAWGSGAPSPLVRPLSAGPFHCPEPPTVDITRVLAHQSTDKTQLSAAPLIEAIQNELKKFKRENTK